MYFLVAPSIRTKLGNRAITSEKKLHKGRTYSVKGTVVSDQMDESRYCSLINYDLKVIRKKPTVEIENPFVDKGLHLVAPREWSYRDLAAPVIKLTKFVCINSDSGKKRETTNSTTVSRWLEIGHLVTVVGEVYGATDFEDGVRINEEVCATRIYGDKTEIRLRKCENKYFRLVYG